MEIRYEIHSSQYLDRKMEYKVYGSKGLPCIALPPEGARFYDWEEKGLVAAAEHWVNDGKLMFICPDSIDSETFLAGGSDRDRAKQHERWICYLLRELLPAVQQLSGAQTPLLAGCGLGASHAVNLFLRQPELFRGVISLSGLYDTQRFFSDTQDDLVFRNSPLLTLAALPETDARLPILRNAKPLVICCGKGPGTEADALADTRTLSSLLNQKQIPACCDEWGDDVTHDWHWWNKQLTYFMENAVFPCPTK